MTKCAIVTGGTRGIGKEICKSLIDDGFKVAAIYAHNDDAAQKFRDETGHDAFKLDVSNYKNVEDTIKTISEEVGDIAVLVNNAGITKDGFLHKMPIENWHDVIDTNLTSCFLLCHAVIPGMRSRGYGRVINISSINGQKGQMGQCNYSAAKAGMLGFTKALAQESAAKGITVNAICPGYIETDMTASMKDEVLESIVKDIPVSRLGKPGEIAAIVSFLASEKAGFITGSTISANGGQYMI